MSQAPPKDFVVAITATGMVTPVGHTAKDSCASIRAGLTGIDSASEFRIPDSRGHKRPATCCPVAGISDGHRRYLRLHRMAIRAFAEAIKTARLVDADLARAGVYLALAEVARPGLDNRAELELMYRIGNALELPDLPSKTRVFPYGHAGIYYALEEAVYDLAMEAIAIAIVGAVDTYLDEITLLWLQDIGRLKTDDNPSGFVPGEGATFLVVEPESAVRQRKPAALARINGLATGFEDNSVYEETPCRGDGLSDAIHGALAARYNADANLDLVICDLNGERYRALEWGLAITRALGDIPRAPAIWYPVSSTGDTGAAAGAIDLCIGTIALSRGYAPSNEVLIWGSSDDGERGAVCLSAVSTT